MNIVYETRKDLPCKDLYELFFAVGFYKKIGFTVDEDYFLTIPGRWS